MCVLRICSFKTCSVYSANVNPVCGSNVARPNDTFNSLLCLYMSLSTPCDDER